MRTATVEILRSAPAAHTVAPDSAVVTRSGQDLDRSIASFDDLGFERSRQGALGPSSSGDGRDTPRLDTAFAPTAEAAIAAAAE